jgi:hypothetical protein
MLETPAPVAQTIRWLPLMLFALKTAIVAAAMTVSLLILVSSIFDRVDDMIDKRLAQLHGQIERSAFWADVERELDHAALPGHAIAPERQAKLLEDIRIIADRARPFALAAATAFEPDNTAGSQQK